MEKVAIARTLKNQLDLTDDETRKLHVRVDAGHITFNVNGHQWQADTAKVAKESLVRFDAGRPVKPHSFTVNATRKGRITRMTEERKKQIRVARAKRVREGRPDRVFDPDRLTLRRRIVGYTTA